MPSAAIARSLLALAAVLVAVVLPAPAAAAPPLAREQALKELVHAQPARRAAAVRRLGEVGRMADADRVAQRLRDDEAEVRTLATDALWLIWSRSGDAATDRLFARGVQQLSEGDLQPALATFNLIVQRRPAFAEGWNKRATVRFLLGDDEASLRDCDEVLKRNPGHFGALSGMAQIYLRRGDPENALRAYERALGANPNLDGGPETLRLLEQAVQARRGRST